MIHCLSTRRSVLVALVVVLALSLPQSADAKKTTRDIELTGDEPNILAIWGDDIGWFNLSIHNLGMMGYETPNIDRIGREGAIFTDAYAEQSCTAGRAAFMTGQHGMRTGMIKVGLPGVEFGVSEFDPSIPQLLRQEYGYTTGQFGKNHLGDTDEFLPTNRGFDEFFGNLYHLNAEEEPFHPDYPGGTTGSFFDKYGPRGVLHTWASGNHPTGGPPHEGTLEPDVTYDQYIINTGLLHPERMKTIDGAFAREAIRFMAEAKDAGKPFFTWYAATRMHVWTHLTEEGYTYDPLLTPEFDRKCYPANTFLSYTTKLCNTTLSSTGVATTWEGRTGYGIHPDGMVEHDTYVGELLDFLTAAGLEDNTIVMYTSDNGPETFSWPDGGTTPFRSEKATNWEGAYRVPLLVRWPGVIAPGVVSNDIIALQDWLPTLLNSVSRAVGTQRDFKTELFAGTTIPNDITSDASDFFNVHLDGYDFYDYLVACKIPSAGGCTATPPREEFIYANDDGVIVSIRVGDWKVVFHEQREHSFQVWQEPFTPLRFPKLFNLRSDPFEKADHESSYYDDFRADRMFALTPAQTKVAEFLQTFEAFPPRQAPPSFTVDVGVQDIIDQCGTADAPKIGNCFGAGAGELALPALGFGG